MTERIKIASMICVWMALVPYLAVYYWIRRVRRPFCDPKKYYPKHLDYPKVDKEISFGEHIKIIVDVDMRRTNYCMRFHPCTIQHWLEERTGVCLCKYQWQKFTHRLFMPWKWEEYRRKMA